ncbi:MAG: tetratricopeptide repeat protein [Flavobacteriales bacterium]|nr:tetratricopeptide repeat protein [Flavobacteriales bacterium]
MKLNQKSIIRLFAILLLVAFTATYWNHFNNGFHFDDSHTIVNNGYVKDLKYFKEYFTDGTTQSSLPTNQSYRPIVTLSAAVDYYLAGNELDPFYFHISTFLWVIFQGIFMFLLFRKVFRQLTDQFAADAVALFAVAWYMLHTANAESINYISARSDIISTALVVAAFVVYQYTTGKKKLWSLPIVIIGILTKPTSVMYVGLLLAYILLFEENTDFTKLTGKTFKSVWNAFKKSIAVIIVCAISFLFTRHMEPETWVAGGPSVYNYLITQPFVILRYFWTFFIPINLSADTDWTLVTSLSDYRFIVGILFLIALTASIIYCTKKEHLRPISFGLIWFIVALVPTSSIIPLAEVTNDHRMFYPFVGLTMAASWGFYLLLKPQLENSSAARTISMVLGLMILAGNAYGTHQRNLIWFSDESLWRDVTIKSPNNGRGLMNYGLAKMRVGDYPTAIDYYNRAFSTQYGNHPYLSLNMAICQAASGNSELAQRYYEKSIQKGSSYPDCHYFYAQWLIKKGDLSNARYHLTEVLRLSPGHENAKQLLDDFSVSANQTLKQKENLAANNPSPENHLNLSLEYYRLKRFEDCIAECRKALVLKPDYAEAYNNICCAYNELNEPEKGIKACEKALELNPSYELAKNNLNWGKSLLKK